MTQVTLGADPEYFAVAKSTGQATLGGDYTQGTKDTPEQLGDGFTIQKDNVMVEMGCPPSTTSDQFSSTIIEMVDRAKAIVSAKGAVLSTSSSCYLSEALSASKDAKEFGCMPSESAYFISTGDLDETSLRVAGGHIHVGHDPSVDSELLIKMLDLVVELPLSMSSRKDYREQLQYDNRTRSAYYAVGGYRIKPYGTEFRTPSNQWTFLTRDNLKILADNILAVTAYCEEDPLRYFEWLEAIGTENVPAVLASVTHSEKAYREMLPVMKDEFGFKEFTHAA